MIAAAVTRPALGIDWTTIDYPGDVDTQLHGISGETILGTWYDFPNNMAGHFLYQAGTFTPLDLAPPDSTDTIPWKIDGNTIVGWYFDDMMVTHAFQFDGSTYQTITPLDSDSAEAKDVFGSVVVGTTSDAAGVHVFRFDGVTTSTLGYPGADITTPEAVLGSTIVGFYGPALSSHGFIYDGVDWTTLDYPGATRTRPLGISGQWIVGEFNDFDSFLYDGTQFTPLAYPGSVATTPWDIEGNNVVGNYYDENGVRHGFLAVVPEPSAICLLALGALVAVFGKPLLRHT